MSTTNPTPTPNLMGEFSTRPPRKHVGNTRGRRWPADPIRVEEFAKLLAACTPRTPGRLGQISALRQRALMIVLFRTGVRISEALAFEENDLNISEQTLLVKRGKGGKRRTVRIDGWGLDELQAWMAVRRQFPPGAIFCVVRGQTAGQPMKDCDVRRQFKECAVRAGLRRRANPHAFRHGFSVGCHREGIDLLALMRQLGHARLDVTQTYLRGIDDLTALAPFAERSAPVIAVPAAQTQLDMLIG